MTMTAEEMIKEDKKQEKRIKELNVISDTEQKVKIFNILSEFIATELKYIEDFCNEHQKEINELKEENKCLKEENKSLNSKIEQMETVNKIYLLLP